MDVRWLRPNTGARSGTRRPDTTSLEGMSSSLPPVLPMSATVCDDELISMPSDRHDAVCCAQLADQSQRDSRRWGRKPDAGDCSTQRLRSRGSCSGNEAYPHLNSSWHG